MIEIFIYLIFGCICFILFGELIHELYSLEYHGKIFKYSGISILFLLLPCAFSLVRSSTGSNDGMNLGPRKLIFQILAWIFYLCCIASFFFIYNGWWQHLLLNEQGWASIISASGMIATVFLVSGFYAIDSCEVDLKEVLGNRLARIMKLLGSLHAFFVMKVLMGISSTALAILAEVSWIRHRNARLAIIQGSLSLSCFIIVLFNTHGLGGRFLQTQKHGTPVGWRFWQPFIGGAKFVSLQIVSWFLFGFGILLEIVFILSTMFIGLEIFVGITALAGLLCMLSEIFMILSLFAFESPVQREVLMNQKLIPAPPPVTMRDSSDLPKVILSLCSEVVIRMFNLTSHLHELIAVVLVVNMQYLTFVVLLPPFLLAGLPSHRSVLVNWTLACSATAFHGIACAALKVRFVFLVLENRDMVGKRRLCDRDAPELSTFVLVLRIGSNEWTRACFHPSPLCVIGPVKPHTYKRLCG